MKKALLAISALSAVFVLLISGAAMGIGTAEAPEDRTDVRTENEYENDEISDGPDYMPWFEAWPGLENELSGLMNDTDDVDDLNGNGTINFDRMVRRGYRLLTIGFNSMNSRWGRLPDVKDIHGADDPGQWMLDYLGNHTGEGINVTDADDDGIPEKVVIVKRFPVVNSTGSEDVPAPEASLSPYKESPNSTSTRIGGWRFVYMDSDDDGIPESISLIVRMKIIFDRDGDGRPEAVLGFFWNGRARDRDGDGTWDVEGYVTSEHVLVDMNGDGNPEKRYNHRASYTRIDLRGRPMWDIITASSSTGYLMDRNSDGNPEKMGKLHMNGKWLDRNGNGWPEVIFVKATRSDARDRDSDGNKEIRDRVAVGGKFIDRNDDKHPELVHISYVRTTLFDTDDDGTVDVIRTISRVFTWIDRNSDGRPEFARRSVDERIHRPAKRTIERSSLRDRVRERIKDLKDERDKNRTKDTSDNPDSRRPEGPGRR